MTVQKERRRVAARRSAHRRNREGPKAPACSLTLTPVRPARPRPGWQGIETARWAQGISQRPQDRERSLEAHCAIRRILALQLGIDPRYLEFDTTTVGKPFLARPAQNLEFNLSHPGRHGLIAVARDRSVGVDIEVRRPMRDLLGVGLQIATSREASC